LRTDRLSRLPELDSSDTFHPSHRSPLPERIDEFEFRRCAKTAGSCRRSREVQCSAENLHRGAYLAAILPRVPHQEVFARGVATRNLVDYLGCGWDGMSESFHNCHPPVRPPVPVRRPCTTTRLFDSAARKLRSVTQERTVEFVRPIFFSPTRADPKMTGTGTCTGTPVLPRRSSVPRSL